MTNSVRAILASLDRPKAHIVYNVMTTEATLYDGSEGSPRMGSTIAREDLEFIFDNGWITKYETRDGEHRYRLTETGSTAIR